MATSSTYAVSPLQWIIYLICFALLLNTYISDRTFIEELQGILLKAEAIGLATYIELKEIDSIQKELEQVKNSYESVKNDFERNMTSKNEMLEQINLLDAQSKAQKERLFQIEKASTEMEANLRKEIKENFDRAEKAESMTKFYESDIQMYQSEAQAANDALRSIVSVKESSDLMIEWIQRGSKRVVTEKYGNPPYYAFFEIMFPPSPENEDNIYGKIIFKFADLEDMPHSLEIFMGLVQADLYSGCTILDGKIFTFMGSHNLIPNSTW